MTVDKFSELAVCDKAADKGQQRVWLKAFETGPSQFLNCYGKAKYALMKDQEVWSNVKLPLKTGAAHGTEYASQSAARRGIAANRWLKSIFDYLEYQNSKEGKKRNKFILNPSLYTALYGEIDRILPHVQVCLAPKKQSIS